MKIYEKYDPSKDDMQIELIIGLMKEQKVNFKKLSKLSLPDFARYLYSLVEDADINGSVIIKIYDNLILEK